MKQQSYEPPTLANPGNLIRTNVGGNLLGSALAHSNEAPFPEDLAEWFIRSLCPPGGTVLDPFGGSGTTLAVATLNGRQFVSADLRDSQCQLQQRRLAEAIRRRDNPNVQTRNARKIVPIRGQRSLFDEREDSA